MPPIIHGDCSLSSHQNRLTQLKQIYISGFVEQLFSLRCHLITSVATAVVNVARKNLRLGLHKDYPSKFPLKLELHNFRICRGKYLLQGVISDHLLQISVWSPTSTITALYWCWLMMTHQLVEASFATDSIQLWVKLVIQSHMTKMDQNRW